MTRSRRATGLRCPPGTAGWWGRLLAALLFAFYVNYIPVHLATAMHLDDAVAAVLDSVLHLHDHADVPSNEQNDGHAPHPASDHVLTFAAQSQAPVVAVFVVFVPAETLLQLHPPEVGRSNPIIERIKPPGESPPGPSQPRAPPLT
ncbi:MAG: hypothetical protein FJ398_22885 [Verrucomicrobia bacterium]|nr:hypothetical protein [Verrucomicrobiota bacterium]